MTPRLRLTPRAFFASGASILMTAGVLLLSGSSMAATTLDFESLVNGEAGPFSLVTVDGTVDVTGSGPNLGVAAFDSDDPGPNSGAEDTDLLVNTGIILIVQDSNEPAITGGVWDVPDDDADGGTITFDFSLPSTVFTIDLVDINGNGPASVTLIDSSGFERFYDVPMDWTGDIAVGDVGIGTLDLLLQADQPGVGPGNPLAIFSQDAGFDENDVSSLEVYFAGSAALDNLVFVPEPGTFLLVSLGLLGLGLGKRRAA